MAIKFPTDTTTHTPIGADLLPIADSLTGNVLKDATVDSVGTTVFSAKSTTDLAEGSNQYYTEAKVSANTDVGANTSARHTHSNKAILDATTASFTTAEETKLAGIEDGATTDQTDIEIKTAYENNADTNVFTDTEKTTLSTQSGTNTGDQTAVTTTYDNAQSGLIATDVKSALDELQENKVDIDVVAGNITLYNTTTSSTIATYQRIVTTPSDVDYDDIAVDVPTGAITTTAQFISSSSTDEGILIGDTGIISLTTIGNVRRTAGSGVAAFYFEVYHRDSLGVETLIGTSNMTATVDSASYVQFFTSTLISNTNFTLTDRIVTKFYGENGGGGSDPSYEFQLGGSSPVRTLFPVPFTSVSHDSLAAVNDAGTGVNKGHLTDGTQTIAGTKTINGVTLNSSGGGTNYLSDDGTYKAVAGSGDGTVKVSADDTTADYIESKIVAGANITVTTLNPGANETFEISTGGTAGEINTASNVGVGGVGIFKQKTGTNLEFKNLTVVSNKLSLVDDTINNEVDLDIVEANLTLSNIGGSVTDAQVPNTITLDNITQITNRSHTGLSDIGTNTHTQIDTHIASTTNPHSVTKAQVGLTNVDDTSDATKNSATATLTNKTVDLLSNTITGTTAQFNLALSDNDFTTLAGTESLTNKTVNGVVLSAAGVATDFLNAEGNYVAAGGGGASFTGINGQTISVAGEISSIEGIIGELSAFASGTFAEMQISTLTRTSGTLTITVKKNGTIVGTATISSATSVTNGRYFGTSVDLADAFVANDVITIEVSDSGTGSNNLVVNLK